MTESKYCPIMDMDYSCQKDGCAWYDSDRQQCAVLTISTKLAEMARNERTKK